MLSKISSCYIEENVVYLGADLKVTNKANTLDDCCHSCFLEKKCQSWLFNLKNKTCTLKSSLRGVYFFKDNYVSGFVKPQCNI